MLIQLRKRLIPAGHGEQVSIPGTETNEPAGQNVHDDAPTLGDMVDGLQRKQTVIPAAGENCPRGQEVQVADEVAPIAVDAVPAAHSWHVVMAVAPTAVEYVPAGQDEQAAAPFRGDLGPHVPAGQPRQSPEPVLPVLAVYVPIGHMLHPAWP